VFAEQGELDAGFDAFMDEEYDEDKIGGLNEEDVVVKSQANAKKLLEEACDEFIDNTKQRFLDLAKEFGSEKAQKLIPDTKSSELIYAEDLANGDEPEEVKQKLREKKLANAGAFEEEALEHADDAVYAEEDEQEEGWDAETILSTYTNTDNHPGVIRTQRRVRPSQRMKI